MKVRFTFSLKRIKTILGYFVYYIFLNVLEHGLSTGSRYDQESEFFNKKCICDEHWSGELCHIPIADQVLKCFISINFCFFSVTREVLI